MRAHQASISSPSRRQRQSKPPPPREGSELGGVAAAGIAIAAAGGVLWASRNFLAGWMQDRAEDATMLQAAMEQRMQRLRCFRQRLEQLPSQAELQKWKTSGVAGADIREFRGRGGYSRAFEEQLVQARPGGRVVHQHEMIWIRTASGRWELVEALLDSGNNCGLVIPRGMAAGLGYCNQAGVPHRMFLQGTAQAATANGMTNYIALQQVPVSIAGYELSMPTVIGPDGRHGAVLIPAQAIRQLQRAGIAFHML